MTLLQKIAKWRKDCGLTHQQTPVWHCISEVKGSEENKEDSSGAIGENEDDQEQDSEGSEKDRFFYIFCFKDWEEYSEEKEVWVDTQEKDPKED